MVRPFYKRQNRRANFRGSGHIELAPKYWAATRARLDQRQLELPVGNITVPPPPAAE
jgi:hypothetical protein